MVKFKFYSGTRTTSGEVLLACAIGKTVVAASYPTSDECQIDLPKCYRQLHRQCIKAHILEYVPHTCSQELYQAVVHVSEGVGIKGIATPTDVGKFTDLDDFKWKVSTHG